MRKETIKKMTVMAMLAALSMVLVYAIHVPLIPVVPFLEYDPADIPILIAAMAYGPVSGLVLTVVVSIIQGMFISTTGPWGILMHVIATGTLVLVACASLRLLPYSKLRDDLDERLYKNACQLSARERVSRPLENSTVAQLQRVP